MKTLMLDATGPIGQQLLQQAIAEGHEVIALARNPVKVEGRDRLTVVSGDFLNPDSLAAAVQNQEAVISSLGTKLTLKPAMMLSEGTKNIVNAMEKQGVRCFICITVKN